jgi:hypothetical protein
LAVTLKLGVFPKFERQGFAVGDPDVHPPILRSFHAHQEIVRISRVVYSDTVSRMANRNVVDVEGCLSGEHKPPRIVGVYQLPLSPGTVTSKPVEP